MRWTGIVCGAAIAASLFFGGATQKGVVSDSIVQFAWAPLVVLLVAHARRVYAAVDRWTLALIGLIVAIPIAQLIPLPPAVWSALPGRGAVLETYASAQIAPPWLGVSISPWATERVAFALLPPIAAFFGFLMCDRRQRSNLLLLVLAIGAISIAVDFLQVIEGPESALRFHAPTNPYFGVGFFANKNHNAAFLYSLIPLAAVVYRQQRAKRGGLALAALSGFYLLVLLGLMTTGSRSALALGALSWALSYLFLLRDGLSLARGRARLYALAIGAVLVVAALALAFGLDTILARFASDELIGGARAMIAGVSATAAWAFFPFGSGLGTFERVFPLFQTAGTLLPAVVNHAHFDPLEIVIETGLAGLLAMTGWMALTARALKANLSEPDADTRARRNAAFIVVAQLVVHSFWDYPLRTSALSVVFAIACAMLASAPVRGARQPR